MAPGWCFSSLSHLRNHRLQMFVYTDLWKSSCLPTSDLALAVNEISSCEISCLFLAAAEENQHSAFFSRKIQPGENKQLCVPAALLTEWRSACGHTLVSAGWGVIQLQQSSVGSMEDGQDDYSSSPRQPAADGCHAGGQKALHCYVLGLGSGAGWVLPTLDKTEQHQHLRLGNLRCISYACCWASDQSRNEI